MKKQLICGVLLSTGALFAGKLPKRTAMLYEADYYNFLNKEVSLNVSSLSPSIGRDKKLKKGFRYFTMNTYDEKTFGGRIPILIHQKLVPAFLKRYGLIDEREEGKMKTSIMNGVLKMNEDFGLYIVPKESAKVSPFPSEGQNKFISDIMNLAPALSPKAKMSVMRYAQKLASSAAGGTMETLETTTDE